MFECDVRLSADGVPFLLHDDALDRTTDGKGFVTGLDWARLSRLDAGSWHSLTFRGEPLATLHAVQTFCETQDCALNVELKPTPGTEFETGLVVARTLQRDWRGRLPPLLSSFRIEALRGAREGAPELPRALLIERLEPDCVEIALGLGCVAVVAHHALITARFEAWLRSGRTRLDRLHGQRRCRGRAPAADRGTQPDHRPGGSLRSVAMTAHACDVRPAGR
ncbi:MAG: hypothetical protein MZV70_72110 [Desulfobacterales bacterium]|nr:hypothetical protein [Desulfobacterales bacterium]